MWSCGLLFHSGKSRSLFDQEKEYFSIYTDRVRSAASSLKGKFGRVTSRPSVDLPPNGRAPSGPIINLNDTQPGYVYPAQIGRFPYSSASLGSSSLSRPSAVDPFAITAPSRGYYEFVEHEVVEDTSYKPLPPLPP